jgi:hypothetical protein
MELRRVVLAGVLIVPLALAANTVRADSTGGRMFRDVSPRLEEALDLLDRQKELPRRTFLFGEDQRSNRRKIDQLLDEAIEMLGVSGLADDRTLIREVEGKIKASQRTIADYQRRRISAPQHEDLGLLDKANPFLVTRQDLDKKIEGERSNISAWEEDLRRLRVDFGAKLRSTGLELDDQAVESLLASVTGDDIVSMAIVFDNTRKMTDQLQALTEQSGENLDTAKRYYGMYLVLVEVLDHIQDRFVEQVTEEHIPALEKFGQQAQKNIDEAQELIRKKKGDEPILRSNIAANETTAEAARHYIDYLRQQSQMVRAENEQVEKTLATARNTYETVKLSSDLAALLESGRQSFNTLMRLRLPYLREFRNESIRREFQRMTDQLRSYQ